MLHLAQGAVGLGGVGANLIGQQACVLRGLEQGDVAAVGAQCRVGVAVGEYQKLHREFDIDHAAGAVLDIKNLRFGFVAGAHALAHGMDLFAQGGLVARAGDDAAAHRLKACLQGGVAQDAARPCHGLVLPGPSGVGAALLLVIGVGGKAADQQAGVAVGP